MPPRNIKSFEFKLDKLGLSLFIFGTALLLFFSFVTGVIVGKNIETYPKAIVAIPDTIRNRLLPDSATEPPVAETTKEAQNLNYSFFKILQKKEASPSTPAKEKSPQNPAVKDTAEQVRNIPSPPLQSNAYIIQVASFKDKDRMEKLKAALIRHGYNPTIEKTGTKTTWYRLQVEGFSGYDEARKTAKSIENKIKRVRCLIVKRK